jgi:Cu2+-exporting ATPase
VRKGKTLMKTVTLEVDDLLSPLAGRGLEKRLSHTAGIAHADVNDASGGVSVTYDPAILDLAAIRALVKECGYHCSGEIVPKHVCYPNGAADTLASTPGRTRSSLAKPVRKQIADGHAAKRDQMVQEMGHGSGMDMGAMVLDMRNRFWICLGFTLALLAFSPMGLKIPSLAPPFGLDLNVVLFVLASGAILYPSWTFVVSAYRALRTGVLNMAVLVVLSVYTGYLFSPELLVVFDR